MILYHGSNFEFDTIDLSKCRPGTDFGQGFYLTPLKEQAEERARGKVRAFGGEAVVSAWEYDEALSHDLKTLTFDLESKEWAEFVYDKPNMQYCFRTVESLKCLRKK